MIATLLLLLVVLDSSPAPGPPPPVVGASLVDVAPAPVALAAYVPSGPASPAIASSPVVTYHAFLPLVARQRSGCAPIPGVQYGTLVPYGLPTDRPAEQHADLNLALRGYKVTDAYRGLIDYDGKHDPKAPQLNSLFADQRVPALTTVYQVYDWDWSCNCRGGLLTKFRVTLAGMGVARGEVLHLPDSGYTLGGDYEALVLYASEARITLKYTRDDNVVNGYTLHVENVCVEPSLLALYRRWNDAGRDRLPALRSGQPFGRARGKEIGVAIRDSGTFMDPRSRRDWWQAR